MGIKYKVLYSSQIDFQKAAEFNQRSMQCLGGISLIIFRIFHFLVPGNYEEALSSINQVVLEDIKL